jgi:hypothetical protein
MTDLEQTVPSHLVDAWNSFLRLPIEHSDDIDEFRHGIHALQKQIMARPTRREINRPLGIQDRTDAAVKAEHERSERLNPNQESPHKAAEAVPERAAKSDANSSQEASESAKSAGEAAKATVVLPTNQPETANEAAGTRPIPSVRSTTPSEPQRDTLGVTVVGTERGTVINSKPQMSSIEAALYLRPLCQKPGREDCGGQGRQHCHSCTMATGEAA